jgi:hypothetical protein
MGVLKGANEYPILTLSGISGEKLRGTIAVADILAADRDALKLYFDITTEDGNNWWWGHFFQVTKDPTRFDEMVFIPTAGSGKVYSTDAKTLGKTVVCPRHWERLPKQIDDYRPAPDEVYVVEDENQEL